MSPLRLPAVVPLVLVLLAGCTPSTPPTAVSATGSMQLAVHLPDALPADVSRVSVTVSGPDMSSRASDLALTDGAWGGVLGELPAGLHRTFLAQAYTASNVLRYQGQADDVTVTAGATGLVSLTLQDVSPPPPFSNEAPVIDSLVASATTLAPGASLSLTSTSHDPNSGDTLTYSWSAPSGSFSSPSLANTNWTAPSTQGPVVLSLKVSDSRGASLTASLTVNVSLGTGADQVNVGFNTAPKVVSLTASQSLLDVGQETVLSVSATDADGDSLSYHWTATCAVSITGVTSPSATFTPLSLPSAACNNCQLGVTVKDGRGGTTTGSLALCVAKDTRRAPPSLTRSYQSSLTAKASQQLTFEVGAMDPAGSALSFAWTATQGTLGTASTGINSSRNTWTAPTCAASGITPILTATVTNSANLSVTRAFTVTGLPRCASVSGWTATGSMATGRNGHAAVLLSSGKVLVSGGQHTSYLDSAELYDLVTGTWSPTGSMRTERTLHTATVLPNGKVLIAAGFHVYGELTLAELYDPATGTWSATGALSVPRYQHTAVLLSNGKVLVVGGRNSTGTVMLATAELYDPATGTWSTTGSLATARYAHTMTLLSTGKVLVSGGYDGSGYLTSSELYDPATGTWSATGSMASPRYRHAATLLPNGKLLASTGISGGSSYPSSSELYDPTTGTWSPTGSPSAVRYIHAATLLSTGKVLISGGTGDGFTALTSAEVYDPATGTWSPGPAMATARFWYTTTRLSNGQVLAVGGFSTTTGYGIATAELYDPGS